MFCQPTALVGVGGVAERKKGGPSDHFDRDLDPDHASDRACASRTRSTWPRRRRERVGWLASDDFSVVVSRPGKALDPNVIAFPCSLFCARGRPRRAQKAARSSGPDGLGRQLQKMRTDGDPNRRSAATDVAGTEIGTRRERSQSPWAAVSEVVCLRDESPTSAGGASLGTAVSCFSATQPPDAEATTAANPCSSVRPAELAASSA